MSPSFAGRPGADSGRAPAACAARNAPPARRRLSRPFPASSFGAGPCKSPREGACLAASSWMACRRPWPRRPWAQATSVTRVPESKAGCARRAASSRAAGGARNNPGLHRQQTLALQLLAGKLAGAADGFRLLADPFLGRFLVMSAQLHLAEDALALHLLLQHLEGLVDIVVTDENLHAFVSNGWVDFQCGHPLDRRNQPRLGRPCSRTALRCPPRGAWSSRTGHDSARRDSAVTT